MSGRYAFLVETYETERIKTLSAWSAFGPDDLERRPRDGDPRGRTPREQMLHQLASEGGWFVKMLGIDVGAETPPPGAGRLDFLRAYAAHSEARRDALAVRDERWWEGETRFFGLPRSRAWVVVRRIAHTAHHRGQLTALLRAWGRELHSTYGPTADTGGLPAHDAPTLYAYESVEALLEGEAGGGAKRTLPGPGPEPATELGGAR